MKNKEKPAQISPQPPASLRRFQPVSTHSFPAARGFLLNEPKVMESTTKKLHSDHLTVKPSSTNLNVPHRLHALRTELFGIEAEAQRINLPGNHQSQRAGKRKDIRLSGATAKPGGNTGPSSLPGGMIQNLCPASDGSPKSPIFLVVDQRITMLFGSRQRTKSVVAAHAAALLGWRAAGLQVQLGAIVFNDRTIEEITPRCTRLRTRLLLHVILSLNHALSPYALQQSDLGMLNEALTRAATSSLGDSRIFLITDGSGWNKKTTSLIKSLSKANKVFVVLIYDRGQIDCDGIRSIPGQTLRHGDCIESAGRPRKLARTLFELSPQIVCGPLPSEVSMVPIHTHANILTQFLRAWGSVPRVSSVPRQSAGGRTGTRSLEQDITCRTGT